jgi:hypothetical protein
MFHAAHTIGRCTPAPMFGEDTLGYLGSAWEQRISNPAVAV